MNCDPGSAFVGIRSGRSYLSTKFEEIEAFPLPDLVPLPSPACRCFICTFDQSGNSITPPTIKVRPLKSCRPRKCPCAVSVMEEPTGLPIKNATLPAAHTIPMRVPRTSIDGQK